MSVPSKLENLYKLIVGAGSCSTVDLMRLALISQSELFDNQYFFGQNHLIPFSRELAGDVFILELYGCIKKEDGEWMPTDYHAHLSNPESYNSFTKIQNIMRHNRDKFHKLMVKHFEMEKLEKAEQILPKKGFPEFLFKEVSND